MRFFPHEQPLELGLPGGPVDDLGHWVARTFCRHTDIDPQGQNPESHRGYPRRAVRATLLLLVGRFLRREIRVVITRTLTAAVAVTGFAVGLASPAWADDRLDGSYTFVDGGTTNTWSITTFCNPEVTCGGSVSSSTGLIANITRVAGGPWTVERHDVPNGRMCADGSTGQSHRDLLYAFDPVSLVGAITTTLQPGVCGDPSGGVEQRPVSLQPA